MSTSHIDPSLKQLADQIGAAMIEQLWARLRNGELPVAPEYLFPKQVSQLTGISVKTLEGMRGTRTGPPYYKPNGRVRYRLTDVREWMERGGPVD
jgi:predicted DNA-binding transcriptional regulator AlpA